MIRAERAFTLVEAIVGLVLLAVVVAMVGSGILAALGGSASSRAGSVSDAAMARTAQQFTSDVASAETSDRIRGMIRDPFALADGVQRGDVIDSTDPTRPGRVDIHDIVVAEDDRLVMMGDVIADGNGPNDDPAECIIWRVRTAGAFLEYVRTVRETCGSRNSVDERVMLRAPNRMDGVVATPFSYVLRCNARACPGSRARASSPCETWRPQGRRGDVTGRQRAWIVGVRMRVLAGGVEGRGSAATSGTITPSVRSRTTSEYTSALGC